MLDLNSMFNSAGDPTGGVGAISASEMANLQKALFIGNDINAPGAVVPGDGFAWRVESLDKTLKWLTFSEKHLKFFKQVAKKAAFNTVEEYNQLLSVGDVVGGGWLSEGDIPSESDSSYRRNYVTIRYMGVGGRVSLQSTMVKPAHSGGILAQEIKNRTIALMRNVEVAMWRGSNALDPLQWDGFDRQITAGAPASNIFDLRGARPTQNDFNNAALVILDTPNFGNPNKVWMNPRVQASLAQEFYPAQRLEMNRGSSVDPTLGIIPSHIKTLAGDLSFENSVFLDDGGGTHANGVLAAAEGEASVRAGVPVISVAAAAGASGASRFAASDAGNYFYWVVGVNSRGKSAPVQVNAVTLTVAAGDAVTFTVTTPAGAFPSYYKVYRTGLDGAANTARWIADVAASAGGAATVVTDVNAKLPGTTDMYMFSQDPEYMAFLQLGPMMKFNLAQIDLTQRWVQTIFGAPVVYAPGKHAIFRNVGAF